MQARSYLLALLIVAGAPVLSARAAPRGPAIGKARYQTSIQSTNALPDADDYVTSLIAGEQLSVTVTASRRSELLPALVLIDPAGGEIEPELKSRRRGRGIQLRRFVIPRTGVWAVRVSGLDATTGSYSIAFKVKAAKPLRLGGQELGDAQLERSHEFEGVEGALLDLTVAWRKKDSAVALRSLRDPGGSEVPGDGGDAVSNAVTRRTRVRLSSAPLASGHGAYAATVAIERGRARYSITAKVRPQGRPRSRRAVRLPADEPFLIGRAAPVRGVAGQAVQFRGGNFVADPPPTVFFGDARGGAVEVLDDGTTVSVVPPVLPEGTTVDIAVANADGQAAVQDGYFHFARPPTITSLLQPSGAIAIGGATVGGQEFTVRGAGLHSEQTVFFGSARAEIVGNPSDEELVVRSPAALPGLVHLSVSDPYGRSSRSDFEFEYKLAPTFDAAPYQPPFAPIGVSVTVTVAGSGFLASDVLLFDGDPVPHTLLDANSFQFDVPALAEGPYALALRDRVGTAVEATPFIVKGAPRIEAVRAVAGSYLSDTEIALHGGTTVEVLGAGFHPLDTVQLGGRDVEVTSRQFDRLLLVAPAGSGGPADLLIRDVAAQEGSFAAAVTYVGWDDVSSARTPGKDSVDDLSALRGALGDLDGDGEDDDLVFVSYGYFRNNVYRGFRSASGGVYNSPGTRAEYTRVFVGDQGTLKDVTADRFPAAGSDPSGGDDWNGMTVALGDVDGSNGVDIVIGGVSPDYTNYSDVRIFTNDGSGTFALETAHPLPTAYTAPVYAYDQTQYPHLVYSPMYTQGLPEAIALGDVDGDGDTDIVVGRDFYSGRYTYVDPSVVDFTKTPPYVKANAALNNVLYRVTYYSATHVFVNPLKNANQSDWLNETSKRMPAAGDSTLPATPVFPARDVALGDVDGDRDLDMVVAWDDPLTVSSLGMYQRGGDSARVATRLLLNDGSGNFTDRTGSWMPPAAAPEFWQAHRLGLHDLDRDGDLDMVLLHGRSVDAYLGTPTFGRHALRILRNDGTAQGFSDVTSASLPALAGSAGDNLRGTALAVRDVDGDGWPDLLVGTTEALQDATGAPLRSTRLLLGAAGLSFRRADDFLPPAATDTGEADELLLGDLSGAGGRPSLLRLSETAPRTSPGAENLRAADWVR